MFGIHGLEFFLFFAVVLLLFGNRIPGIARSLGLSITEFKRGVKQADEDESIVPAERGEPSTTGKRM